MNSRLTEHELSMEGWYFSATDENRKLFPDKVDDVLDQVRLENLGRVIKSIGFDEDGDFALLIDHEAIGDAERIAAQHKLVLFRLGPE